MFRILSTIIIIVALYFMFLYLGNYDSAIVIEAYNYKIKSSVFFIIAILLIYYVLFTVFIKAVLAIVNAPSNVISFFSHYQSKRDNNNILAASSHLIAGNYIEATNIAKKYLNHKQEVIQKTAKVIMSKAVSSREKLNYLQEILRYPELKLYANKTIAGIMLQSKDYGNALTFATEAQNIDKNDVDTAKLLLEVHANLEHWHNFKLVLDKLNNLTPDFVQKKRLYITENLFKAAKHSLEIGNDREAVDYLEQSILYQVDFLPSINLLAELYNNIGKQQHIITIIEQAFSYKPAYELFEIYKEFSTEQPAILYANLTKNVDVNHNLAVLIKIAHNLKIDSNISYLADNKLISNDS